MPATPTSSARHSTAHAESELRLAQARHVVVRTTKSRAYWYLRGLRGPHWGIASVPIEAENMVQRYALSSVVVGLVIVAGSAVVGNAASADQQRRLLPAQGGAESTLSRLPPPRGTACYSQLNGADVGGVVSQNFEKIYDTLDASGADDVLLRGTCRVSQVSVEGSYLNFAELPSSMHVTFYRSSRGQVGEVLSNQDNLSFAEPINDGDFVVDLARPVTLLSGRYWVSVQANMSFTTQGEWYWSTNETQRNNKAKWANPKDGWGTFCTTWKDVDKCFSNVDPDFTFALLT
jgi:hypothetical protein